MADRLTNEEVATLAKIAGLMIPPSETHAVPGADDPRVMASIVEDANTNVAQPMKSALSAWNTIDATDDDAHVAAFLTDQAGHAGLLQTVISRVYYCDDRVMISLGMEPRAPFPKGFEVGQGDWSLLDPVRDRGEIWRKVN